MNIFKQKEQEISTGFYYDRAKNKIVYCYVDHKSEYFGNISIYNRNSGERSSNFLFMADNYSNVKDLTDINLELLSNNKNSTILDFKWLSSEKHIEQEFVKFLIKQELYLVLKMFNERESLLPKIPATRTKEAQTEQGIIILK